MRVNGIGCGGLVGICILIVIIWNVGGYIISSIWDGTQEILAERHVKQELADARAREKAAQKVIEDAVAEARAAEARRVEAETAERCRREAAEAAEHRRREEAERREAAARKEAAAKREATKFEKLRTFAVSDAPSIWRAYQDLDAAIAEQDMRIKDLAAALREFDKEPEKDADYLVICSVRGEMADSLKVIRKNLEEAYFAYCRFKATSNHKEYAELMRKALDDGAQAADAATRKFEQMKVDK